jgi:hypothetical protein
MKKIITLMFVLLLSANAMADINKVLNYQGYLTDVNNQPIADGQYIVQFKLYAQASGGAEIWNETQSFEVVKGYFNTTLGNINALQTSLFDSPLWLGIAVGSDSEMVPRKKLGATAYAMNIADDVVTSQKIKNGEIKEVDIGDAQVTSQKIADHSVTNYWQHIYEPSGVILTDSLIFSTFTSLTITAKGSGDLLVKLNASGYASSTMQANYRIRISKDGAGFRNAPSETGIKYYHINEHHQYGFDWIFSNVGEGTWIVEVQWKRGAAGAWLYMDVNDTLTLVIIELKK